MTPAELSEWLRLVVITDARLAYPRRVGDVAAEAVEAGARAVQLRNKGETARELMEVGRELRELTRAAGALLFVNDRLDVALALEADGVHLGPDDLAVGSVRRVVPAAFLIGCSADDANVAAELVRQGADYVGCGTVYPTSTKADAGETVGLDGLDRVARAVSVPVLGIGGMTPERAAAVATTAASGVAVVGAVMAAPDVREAVRALMAPWIRPRARRGPAAAEG